MDNDGGTSDFKAPVFDMESERSELDTNDAETRSSCIDDCSLDDVFSSTGSDVSEDEFSEFHHNDQRFDTTELNYNTMTCVIDVKGIVKSCVEQHNIPKEKKPELLGSDLATIENHLTSFLDKQFVLYKFDTRDQLLDLINITMKDISKLDDYWNGHYLVIEELNRQINELIYSDSGQFYRTPEVENLYTIYVGTKFNLQDCITSHYCKLASFDEVKNFLMKFNNWTPYDRPVFRRVTSHSESVTSYSHSNSESEFCTDDDRSDGCESLFNTDSVDEDVETHSLNNTDHFRRNAETCSLILTIIALTWSAYTMGILRCCEIKKDDECMFEFGLWCIIKLFFYFLTICSVFTIYF